MTLNVYLSGEIHSTWREEIADGIAKAGLSVTLTAPVTNHEASDNCGVNILGEETNDFWKDHKAAKLNVIRTRNAIQSADIVVVRFGEKHRQWNAAFDAGYAVALGKSLIVLHDPKLTHPLKEVDATAMAVAEHPEQVVSILEYVLQK